MPKNRYSVKVTGSSAIYTSDNLIEVKVEDNLRKPAAMTCVLNGITTSDWGAIKENALIEIYYYNSAGTISTVPTFYGVITKVKYMTQNSVGVEAGDMSVKLKRVPLATKDRSIRGKYSATNKTLSQIVNELNSDNMDGNGTPIVSIGTIENGNDVIAKFEAFSSERWSAMQSLAEQTKRIAYFDVAGYMNMTSTRGADYRATGTGTFGTNTLTDSSKSWTVNEWTGYVLRDSGLRDFIIVSNTATVLTLSGTPYSGTYFIIRGYFITGAHNAAYGDSERNGEEIWNDIIVQGPGGVASRYRDISTKVAYLTSGDTRLAASYNSGAVESGAVGTGTTNTWTDASKSWSTNQFANYILEDDSLNLFTISANTATALTVSGTPASGNYNIYQAQMEVESTVGIPNSPGIVYLEGGSPTFKSSFTEAAFGKVAGFYYYTGVSGKSLTGVGWLAANNPQYEFTYFLGGASYTRGQRVYFINKIRTDNTTGFTTSNAVMLIGQEEIDYAMKDSTGFYPTDCGTGSNSSTTVTDTSKAWTTNCWVNYVYAYQNSSTTTNHIKITANDGTHLTLASAPPAGTLKYLILPAQTPAATGIYHFARKGRNPYQYTALTKTFFAGENTLVVSDTAAFDTDGFLQIMNNAGPVEIVRYTSKDSTHFYLPTDGSGRAQLGTVRATASEGCTLRQYGESVIHPVGVRVQQFPTGGTPETDSSVGTNGKRTRFIDIKTVISIEDAERFASRILMNKRFGDIFISFISYSPQDYNRLVCGDLVEVTDSTLSLANYANNITKKELYMNTSSGEFFTKFYIANPPISEFEKLMRTIKGEIGNNPRDEVSYVTGDDPKKLLRELCGAPGCKLDSAGLDASNESGTGYLNCNRLYSQPYAKTGPTFRSTPVYLWGVRIYEDSMLQLGILAADPSVGASQAGGLYFNSSTSKFRSYNGSAWADLGSGGSSTNYWVKTGSEVAPDVSNGIYYVVPSSNKAQSLGTGGATGLWWSVIYADQSMFGNSVTNVNIGTVFGADIYANGSQTNIDLNLYSKGTGKINLSGPIGPIYCGTSSGTSGQVLSSTGPGTSPQWINQSTSTNYWQTVSGGIQPASNYSAVFPNGTSQDLGSPTGLWDWIYANWLNSAGIVVGLTNSTLHIEVPSSGSVDIFASGSASNCSIDFRPKGSGNLQLWPDTGIIEAGASILSDQSSGWSRDLGSSTYKFRRLYLSDSTGLNADTVDGCHVDDTNTGLIHAQSINSFLSNTFHLEPTSATNTASLGSMGYEFNEGHFDQLWASTRVVIPTSAPSSPIAGTMYFNSSTNYLYIYNGTSWKSVLLT